MPSPILLALSIILVFVGFTLVALAFLLRLLREGGGREVEKHGGAVVMIGPLPLVLASDAKTAKILMVLAIILTVTLIALVLLSHGLARIE
ncbi:MAG: TIGR00304 family membrane protein [Thermoproteota archaeon]